MNASLKLYTLTSLTLSLSLCSSFAAESTVYQFKDGTVTVTPRDSAAGSTPRIVTRSNNSAPASLPTLSDEPRLMIRPVSYRQEAPAPMPEEGVSQIKKSPEPATVVPQLQSSPVASEVASQADCCGPVITPHPSDALPKSTVTLSTVAMYRDVYNAIPFSRVEFNHYPNYRHDATMEFLFNQMRTTIINRNTGSVGNDYTYGPAYGGYMGYPYYDPPAYPFSYGLRIHRSR